jgi:phospholipid/cholesterol/gamma-HCH transport system substrate-binding protein
MKLTAFFADSGDLQSRGSVQMADVRIGSISRITLTPDFRSKVEMSVNRGVQIPKNTEAVLADTSLLGERFVNLVPGGSPSQGPFLRSGDTISQTSQAPELEFVAQSAVELLAAVNTTSVATLIDTGAQAVANKTPELASLIRDLNSVSATLAGRTTQIGQVIDNLDHATRILAGAAPDLSTLLVNLAQTSQLLAQNRNQVVTGLASLTRLAQASNYSLEKYGADLDRQIKQVDVIAGALASASGEVGNLIDWFQKFVTNVPKVIANDFTQIYMWAVPFVNDPRSKK